MQSTVGYSPAVPPPMSIESHLSELRSTLSSLESISEDFRCRIQGGGMLPSSTPKPVPSGLLGTLEELNIQARAIRDMLNGLSSSL